MQAGRLLYSQHMSNEYDLGPDLSTQIKTLEDIRDVSDFFQKWSMVRGIAEQMTDDTSLLTDHEKNIISWFIFLMDRISEEDVNTF